MFTDIREWRRMSEQLITTVNISIENCGKLLSSTHRHWCQERGRDRTSDSVWRQEIFRPVARQWRWSAARWHNPLRWPAPQQSTPLERDTETTTCNLSSRQRRRHEGSAVNNFGRLTHSCSYSTLAWFGLPLFTDHLCFALGRLLCNRFINCLWYIHIYLYNYTLRLVHR